MSGNPPVDRSSDPSRGAGVTPDFIQVSGPAYAGSEGGAHSKASKAYQEEYARKMANSRPYDFEGAGSASALATKQNDPSKTHPVVGQMYGRVYVKSPNVEGAYEDIHTYDSVRPATRKDPKTGAVVKGVEGRMGSGLHPNFHPDSEIHTLSYHPGQAYEAAEKDYQKHGEASRFAPKRR